MATTFQNKINELEARLRAENESRANDPMIRSLSSDKPSPRRPLPFDQFKSQNTGSDRRKGAQLHQERTASPGAPPIPPRRRIQSPAVSRNSLGGNENFNQTVDLPQQNLSQTVPYVNTRHQQHQRSVSVERSSFSDAHAYYRHTRAAASGTQTGSGIPVSNARGRLFSTNSDANNKQSKRKQVQSGIHRTDNSTDNNPSAKTSQNASVKNGDNQSSLGFENNFTDIVDIPKSSSGRPTLVRKKSDLDKPRVDIPPGATYNPQSSKKVIYPQGRSTGAYDASKTGRSSPRYSNSLRKSSGSPSVAVGTNSNAVSFEDSFDTSWAKSSLSQSKGSASGLPQSDAPARSSGIPRGHLHRSSFEKDLGQTHSPGRSSLSQVPQHTSSPLRSNPEFTTPRTLSNVAGSLEQSFDRSISNTSTQDTNRQSNIVSTNGNVLNVSSPPSSGVSGPGSLNFTSTYAMTEQVYDSKYIPSNNTSFETQTTFDNGVQIPHINGGIANGDKHKQKLSLGIQKNARPTDMFKMNNTPASQSFMPTNDGSRSTLPMNGPSVLSHSCSNSPLRSGTPTSTRGSVEQVNSRSDVNTNTSIPQPQSSPRNAKSAIPRPSRPTLNFGTGLPATNPKQQFTDINARNNNHVVSDSNNMMMNMTNGPLVDTSNTSQHMNTSGTGQHISTSSTGRGGQMGWNNRQNFSTPQHNHPTLSIESGGHSLSTSHHITSPPMITSPPYQALYERQTQSPRSLSSGSPSSIRSQSSTPTPTRPSLNFGSRMTSPGLNLPIRHIPTSISSCDMSFESPDSPGSLSLPGRPSFISSPSSPGGATVPLRPGSAGTPAPLNFSNPGIMRKKKEFHLPMSSGHSRTPDANEIELKYQEIMKRCGILTLDRKRIPTSIHELEHVCDLGHGTCGHVVKMRHVHTGHVMAVKQMRRSGNRDENKRIIMDLDVVVKSHNCPYIVRCIGTFVTSTDVWICMELMSTCLEKLLKKYRAPIPEEILGKVATATVNALHYLKEEHGVIHRDIKPSNILLNENGDIKLCDFGISGRLVDSKAKTRSAGCAAYMAPERIDPPDPTRPDYDIRADVWSLGISLVELATGAFPYKNCKTDFEVLTRVLQEDPPVLPPGEGFSRDLCSFVWHCLTKDYKKRPKYRELLKHPFIKRYNNTQVDVASWYASVLQKIGPPTPITENLTKP